jgi:dTDP-4-amino-4,6-dideoxygalactose transaminase
MYAAVGIGKDSRIITSPLTFVATANAAQYLGAHVDFVDINLNTGNIDVDQIPGAFRSDTKAVVAVDYAGLPADYDEIYRSVGERPINVLADAAHSFGGSYKGRKVGALADATEISFHPVKPVTTGEGGAVLTNDKNIKKKTDSFRSHGIVRDINEMIDLDGPWYYEMHSIGFNYRLSDIGCALGISQLSKIDAFISRRNSIAAMYDAAFADLSGDIILPYKSSDIYHAYHLYVIRLVDHTKRLSVFENLHSRGIKAQVHYVPVHLHPFYRGLGYKKGQFPNTEMFYDSCISIPIFPKMSNDEVYKVIDTVREVLGR